MLALVSFLSCTVILFSSSLALFLSLLLPLLGGFASFVGNKQLTRHRDLRIRGLTGNATVIDVPACDV